MEIILFSGSLRADSFNKKLITNVSIYLTELNVKSSLINLIDFGMPLYNEDIETSTGIPSSVHQLAAYIKNADALIIASPEYNGSISSPLKNTIDWLSRCKPMPLADKHLLLLSTSPAKFGGVRGVWHTRVPFEMLGVHVFPAMFCLEQGHTQFNDKGTLIDAIVQERLKKMVDNFVSYVHMHL